MNTLTVFDYRVHLQILQKAVAGVEWAMVATWALFHLSFFDEFRYVTLEPDVVIKPRGRSALD